MYHPDNVGKEPSVSLDQAKAIVETKTAPRVTEQSIKDKIVSVEYVERAPLTICILRMQNGFFVTGISASAAVENYDQRVGERYAYDNAFKQLWPLEGYLLREQLHHRELDDQYARKNVL